MRDEIAEIADLKPPVMRARWDLRRDPHRAALSRPADIVSAMVNSSDGAAPAAAPVHGGHRAPTSPLESIDEQLIELLLSDGRASYADLGAHVGLSGDAVRDRLRRLGDRGVVQVVGSVSAPMLGLDSFALIGITVDGSGHAVAQRLSELPNADLVVQTAGIFDVVVELVCRDDIDLLAVLDEHIRTIPGVGTCNVMVYLSVGKYTPGGPRNALIAAARDPRGPEGPRLADLSESDRALIALLQENGRATYQQLASVSGLNYASARRRVKRLLDEGIVHVATIVNPLVYSHRTMAGVGINISGPIPPVVDAIAELPQVEMIVVTTGRYDAVLEVSCRDRQDLAELIGTSLRSISGVRSTHTFGYVHFHKLPYTWSGLQP
jgi:Lrp/AsnC family transcriptional regulator for asnA, asnC and gidA